MQHPFHPTNPLFAPATTPNKPPCAPSNQLHLCGDAAALPLLRALAAECGEELEVRVYPPKPHPEALIILNLTLLQIDSTPGPPPLLLNTPLPPRSAPTSGCPPS
jgi:hypothetical protein